jgi:chromosome segregation ATPase
MVENETMKASLRAAQQKFEASREIQAKLEIENHQMADELDVNRDKVTKLVKAEAAIEKYQQRLEEMVALKKQNKELSEKMDEYLDKIHDLESSNKAVSTMNKMVDQYKDKAVELEREKFEAMSGYQMKTDEVIRVNAELLSLKGKLHACEGELSAAREEIARQNEVLADATLGDESVGGPPKLGAGGADAFEVETVASLREKYHKLELEVKVLREAGGSGNGGESSGHDSEGHM